MPDMLHDRACGPAPALHVAHVEGVLLTELAILLKAVALVAGYATKQWTVPRISALIQERFGTKLVDTSV